jgi:hypothetical protein
VPADGRVSKTSTALPLRELSTLVSASEFGFRLALSEPRRGFLFALCDYAHDESVETCNMLFPRRIAMKEPSMERLVAVPSGPRISRELATNQCSATVCTNPFRSCRDLTDGWPTRRSGTPAR